MLLMAMDRATVRRRDPNGFLHVDSSHISKANVCPYYGREIPGWREMGLDAERIYDMYRDPAELAKAAGSFNNVPVLSEHLPVVPDELPGDLIIGSTGTDAEFDGTYLDNSLVVWCGDSQMAIDANRKRELSCGYRYRADMSPGRTPAGLQYDGVMRDIVGNHVALVFQGRAGPDVVVGDELMKLKSRTALMISGALAAMVRPLLATDARVDVSDALKGVDAKSFAMDGAPKALAGQIVTLVTPHLAADKALDADALETFISAIQPVALDEDTIADPVTPPAPPAPPAPPSPPAPPENPPAMDRATVEQMVADAEARGAARVAAIGLAQRDVEPLVGEVLGHDSAEGIYRFALDTMGVPSADIADAPLGTLKAFVAREVANKAKPLALDRKPTHGKSKLAAIVPNLPPMIRS